MLDGSKRKARKKRENRWDTYQRNSKKVGKTNTLVIILNVNQSATPIKPPNNYADFTFHR